MTDDARRLIVAALEQRREHGCATAEIVLRRAGLERTTGYRVLAALERGGLVSRDPREGLVVSFTGRMMAGL